MDLKHIRQDYIQKTLSENEVTQNPVDQFRLWYQEAIDAKVAEPNAMVLSTVNNEGRPSARVVLLKEIIDNGFVFYTNYDSRKGKELTENPFACLTFFWQNQERQVRIEGKTERTPVHASEDYFHSRPKQSQLAAMASRQSSVIKNRAELEDRFEELSVKFKQNEIPTPQNWGGFRLVPESIEFWQGRASRLHDRIRYTLQKDTWMIERLAP